MGDCFQRLAATAVTRSQAGEVAAGVWAWLQEERIICAEPSDCVLGNPAGGYRPGPEWRKAVALGQSAPDELLRWAVNGVEIIDAPVVHCIMESEPFEAICPGCGAHASPDFVDDHILLHVEAWQNGDDTIVVVCPQCVRAASLLAWRVNGIALAHLGLVFWNWPSIADAFIAILAERTGSEIITLSGKL
jgi:hypothetical protein